MKFPNTLSPGRGSDNRAQKALSDAKCPSILYKVWGGFGVSFPLAFLKYYGMREGVSLDKAYTSRWFTLQRCYCAVQGKVFSRMYRGNCSSLRVWVGKPLLTFQGVFWGINGGVQGKMHPETTIKTIYRQKTQKKDEKDLEIIQKSVSLQPV